MSKPITDHEDNHFPSVKDMCAHWGIAQSTYHGRIRKGLSQKQALADPGAKRQYRTSSSTAKTCTDHTGQTFSSIEEMCQHWQIPYRIYINRMKNGKWSQEKTLTTPVNTGTAITDHLGNTFASIPAFAKAYNIPVRQAYDRIANHFSVIETLDYIPLINHLIKNYKFDDKLIIIEKLANEKKQNRNKDPYYKCLFNNHEVILTRDFIIQYCTKELRKQHAQTQTAS